MKERVLFLILVFYFGALFAADTVLKLYRPFGDTGVKGETKVVKKLQGQCSQQSQLILREDAWRCVANGQLFDPCFASLGTKQLSLLCPTSPWSNENIEIEVDSRLNNQEHQALDMSRTFPWAIELSNGERCQAIEANQQYDSMPVRYRCTNQNWLVGTIQRCDPVWSMLEKTPNGVVTIELKQAWF